MENDYTKMEEQNIEILKAKISLIKFFYFDLKPFPLGVTARYVRHRKYWDEFYLQENEWPLFTFLNYVLDYNLLAGKLLREHNKPLFNLATEILHRETEEPIADMNNWKAILLSLNYIDTKNEDSLESLPDAHPKGKLIADYLRFVMTKSPESKKALFAQSYYAGAFAQALMFNHERALKALVIGFRKNG